MPLTLCGGQRAYVYVSLCVCPSGWPQNVWVYRTSSEIAEGGVSALRSGSATYGQVQVL